MTFEFTAPVQTKNESNQRGMGWFGKASRAKKQRTAISALFPKWKVAPAVRVTLTRISAGELDDDNLRSALKAVRDEVAACMRIDDGSRLVEWAYAQKKGEPKKPAVHVRVEVIR